ncbi:MAG: hypothetical protein R2911_39900 [Caldilineaceae bacterium]
MGHRHLYGLAELHRAGLSRFELVGACDPVQDNAESLAQQAENLHRRAPAWSAIWRAGGAGGAGRGYYHHAAITFYAGRGGAYQRGWHAMIEKPVGLTVRAANVIRAAAAKSDRIVSVAESYRRDPINRLGKALLDAGAIGAPRFMIHNTAGGNQMMISVWRHMKEDRWRSHRRRRPLPTLWSTTWGLSAVSMHRTPARAHPPQPSKRRRNAAGQPAATFTKWQRQMPADFEVTAERRSMPRSLCLGAAGQYALKTRRLWPGHLGAADLRFGRFHESAQRPHGPPDHADAGGPEPISDERLLDLVPDFRLNRLRRRSLAASGSGATTPLKRPTASSSPSNMTLLCSAILGEHPIDVSLEQGCARWPSPMPGSNRASTGGWCRRRNAQRR